MSQHHLPPGIRGLLIQRLRAIPKGEITATAERAGLALEVLLRLRRGQATDVKLTTLEKLAKGLQLPPSAVIAAPGEKAHPAQPVRQDPRIRRALQRVLDAFDVIAACHEAVARAAEELRRQDEVGH